MTSKYLFYRDNWNLKRVLIEDILFLETSKNYITIVLGEGERYFASRCSLDQALKQLPAEQFARVNGNQAVALAKVEKIGRTSLFLMGEGKYELTISPKFMAKLRSKITILGKDRTSTKK
jgi:DNA-binding LytR/AlgR family response regulator